MDPHHPEDKKTILVIEDEQAIIDVLQGRLLKAGYDVQLALNADEGLRKVKSAKPSCIILDLILPDIDGGTILKRLKKSEETKDIPVIVLSNLGGQETTESKKLGAIDHLVKSDVDLAQIVQRVRTALFESEDK